MLFAYHECIAHLSTLSNFLAHALKLLLCHFDLKVKFRVLEGENELVEILSRVFEPLLGKAVDLD